ncbi:MAG: cytochrome c oxidase subunit 1 [Verrucomicrobiales bacterium]|jgi:cytochrome c oxidase subunit 1
MDAKETHNQAHDDHDHDDHDHYNPNFLEKYVFSTDHKVIGIQYGISGLVFLLFGFYLMLVMRYSIASPGEEMPLVLRLPLMPVEWLGGILQNLGIFDHKLWSWERWAPITALIDSEGAPILVNGEAKMGHVISPELYNMFGAMHGTIMVFMGVVPLGFAAFGNFVTPLQIGAPDMAFPRLNMWSFWVFAVGGFIMMVSFFIPTGAAQAGWTNYSPLATTMQISGKSIFWTGPTQWLLAMVFVISSSLLGAVNFITTIINLRAKGLTWMRLPFFVWAMLVTGFLLLLAFPPLEVAALMQLSDRMLGSSFFLPTGLVEGGVPLDISGGGSPILYQHLFWFLAHPEVYVLLLPGIAIVSDIIPNNTRKPLWGYKSMVYGVMVLGFLSFIVWAHHMYLTGMGTMISTFFQTTTVLISVPSVILLTCLMISLWGGSIRFTVPMLFATAFLPMFGFGGLTGLPLAFNLVDLFLHDTYYVIAHFHYIVAPGTVFALFAGIYYWYPKATGRMMSNVLGHLHFWPSLVCMNVIFLPMFVQGMAGFHRRWYDGGKFFEQVSADYLHLNDVISYGAYGLALAQVFFIINFFGSLIFGRKATSDNPWHATTLEWAAPNVPPHGNFLTEPVVYRGPYEYSVPGADKDYTPQFEPDPAQEPEAAPEKTTAPSH